MVDEKYLVSVIIPVYNAEKYIKDILHSVCNQTYKNIEIIVVDDGSKDASASIIHEFCEDKRVKYVHQENSGVSAARNTGLSIASGEFIRFIDADDSVPYDSIEHMIKPFLEHEEVDLVVGNFMYSSIERFYNEVEANNEVIDSERFARLFLRYPKSFYYGVPWNKLYRRSIIVQHDIKFDPDIRWCEDFIFNVEYYSKCRYMYHLNVEDGIYVYRDTPGSLTDKVKSFPKEEQDYIAERRLSVGRAFADSVGLNKEFEIWWSYSNLFGKLSALTRIDIGPKGVKKKYRAFKDSLQGEEIYRYVADKASEKNANIWRMLKRAMEKQRFLNSFLCFYVKGICRVWLYHIIPKGIVQKCKRKVPGVF